MQHSLKRKFIYLGLIGCYIAGGIWGTKDARYVIQHPVVYFPVIGLIVLELAGLLLGWLAFYHFRLAFPKGWQMQNRFGRLALPVVFFILSSGMMYGYGLLINGRVGKQEALQINGRVKNKKILERRKSTQYYIELTDSITQKAMRLQ